MRAHEPVIHLTTSSAHPVVLHDLLVSPALVTHLTIVVEQHIHVWLHHIHSYFPQLTTLTLIGHEYSQCTYFLLGDASPAISCIIQTKGTYASINLYAITALRGLDQMTLTTRQEHYAPFTHSSLIIKAVVTDQAVMQYDSMIYIGADAHQAQAIQHAATLMLSPDARSNTKPQLEVLTDDVRCKHGSAVSHFNEDQAWYLMSRGLPLDKAHELLLEAFFVLPGYTQDFVTSLLQKIKYKEL